MKKKWNLALLSFFLIMVLLGSFTIHSIISIQSYGQLINYVGIVRGATQRLVKLELQGEPNNQLVSYMDDILDNLTSGSGKYDLVLLEDEDYLKNLKDLNALWVEVKEDIYSFRKDSSKGPQLLKISETYFALANKTVFSAEAYSSKRTHALMIMIVLLSLCVLLIWLFIFWGDMRRILHLEKTNQNLNDKAGRDILTGAYNLERFKSIAQLLIDSNPAQKYAIFYIDFADFKYINDVFGYAYGDSILINYSKIMEEDLEKDEVFGRVNADNFVALKKYTDKEELLPRQKQADQKIINYMLNSYDKHSLPVCCGICCIEDVIENLRIEGLLDRANFARKTVKNGTYMNYAFYDESIRQKLFEEKSIESNMVNALENKEFTVYYQPKVDLATGKIACAEALVRWEKEDGTIVPPDKFIPIFEKDFSIAKLDQYVFKEVCKWLNRMILEDKQPLPVSVNVSRLQFYNSDFVKTYTDIRDKYKIPAGLLEIEFTETIVFDNTALLINIVSDLRKAGFSCSIDDFGKGYSSLGLLKNLSVDVLKIDRQFFIDLSTQEKDRAVVEGIITLVRRFNITTVAEGIESMDQVEFLKSVHCDMVQGYVFYKPMPQRDYEKLLDAQSQAAVHTDNP